MRIDAYDWAGGREAMLRFGPDEGPVVVVAMPLFEEANRIRALIVRTLRELARRGIASALPDLPGQGESVLATDVATLVHWRSAFAAATRSAGERRYVFAVRGGALVSGEANACAQLHLEPEPGRALVHDLLRARRAAALLAGERLVADDPRAPGPPLMLAGNMVGQELLQDLMDAEPATSDRLLRLFPSGAPADCLLAPNGPPNADGDLPRFRKPWVAAEPFVDPALASALADAIADWVIRCER